MLFWAYLKNVILSTPEECYFEHTWRMLFWAYLKNVILSIHEECYFKNVILSIPEECYFELTRRMLFWAYLKNVILIIPEECYFEHTWRMLFQKRIVCTKFDIYVLVTIIITISIYTSHNSNSRLFRSKIVGLFFSDTLSFDCKLRTE